MHEDDHHAADDEHDSGFHATLGGYVVGFVLSVILTAIPFWLVMGNVFESTTATIIVILAFARCRSSSTWCTSCT